MTGKGGFSPGFKSPFGIAGKARNTGQSIEKATTSSPVQRRPVLLISAQCKANEGSKAQAYQILLLQVCKA
jgi:hypothetical protein